MNVRRFFANFSLIAEKFIFTVKIRYCKKNNSRVQSSDVFTTWDSKDSYLFFIFSECQLKIFQVWNCRLELASSSFSFELRLFIILHLRARPPRSRTQNAIVRSLICALCTHPKSARGLDWNFKMNFRHLTQIRFIYLLRNSSQQRSITSSFLCVDSKHMFDGFIVIFWVNEMWKFSLPPLTLLFLSFHFSTRLSSSARLWSHLFSFYRFMNWLTTLG